MECKEDKWDGKTVVVKQGSDVRETNGNRVIKVRKMGDYCEKEEIEECNDDDDDIWESDTEEESEDCRGGEDSDGGKTEDGETEEEEETEEVEESEEEGEVLREEEREGREKKIVERELCLET